MIAKTFSRIQEVSCFQCIIGKKTKVKKEKVQAAGGPATDTEDEVSIQAPARGQKRTSTETEA